ncbi:hypothetical protein MBSD_n1320 [Mizugakiibacter sediminis]|uniref:DUF2007 domain-containing protein n=1 Tax=Mizugakiibacter sediminis TaxID=1475481 RepID=A0A0K8QMD4_9GAMM|nr:DUF2007 domain-containing protein [Mizugakiibacter sediminis]GAP66018.1 hypothetical protein MBSD_n1320 [Mizugakiibacter sediminis]
MRTVYRAESIIDAHLVKGALEQAGIPAYVAGEYLTGGIGQLPARDLIAVMVPDSLVAAAEPRVRELQQALAEARDTAGSPASGLPPDGDPQPA